MYLLEEQYCQISSRPNLKYEALCFFEVLLPNKNKKKNNNNNNKMGSVPGAKNPELQSSSSSSSMHPINMHHATQYWEKIVGLKGYINNTVTGHKESNMVTTRNWTIVNSPSRQSFFQQNFIIIRSQEADLKPRPLTRHSHFKLCATKQENSSPYKACCPITCHCQGVQHTGYL